jgi:uncharacterized protein (DUF1330 family)
MKAYVLAHIRVHDPERMKIYSRMATPIVAQFGGRYLVRGGDLEALEGSGIDTAVRLVIIEFPDAASARSWWNSPEYQEAKKLRQQVAHSDLLIAEGAPPSLP